VRRSFDGAAVRFARAVVGGSSIVVGVGGVSGVGFGVGGVGSGSPNRGASPLLPTRSRPTRA